MPRIKLSNWYGDKAPGDEIDVDETTLKALRRDGRVAEVLGAEQGGMPEPGAVAAVEDTVVPERVEPASPETGRKRR